MRKQSALVFVLIALASCKPKEKPADPAKLQAFAADYAAAWSSQNASRVAVHYSALGALSINGGKAIGRAAITADAQNFMSAFPDMVVSLDSLVVTGEHPVFHWTLTGTNTGPGGTGKTVRISGYEVWTLGPDGLITLSDGHFDAAEYQRQLKEGVTSGAAK